MGLINYLYNKLFNKRNTRIAVYGIPNAGKSTLANSIVSYVTGTRKQNFKVSKYKHETKSIKGLKNIEYMFDDGKTISFDLYDTPGISEVVDYNDFHSRGISKVKSKKYANELTKGIVETFKWVNDVDVVIFVIDGTANLNEQMNFKLYDFLQSKKKKVVIAANKMDLPNFNMNSARLFNGDRSVSVPISAKTKENIDILLENLR